MSAWQLLPTYRTEYLSSPSVMNASASSPRVGYLDALRGIAILGVIAVHSSQEVMALPAWLDSVAAFGARGVQLFFIVSALTLVMVSDRRDRDVKSFFLRRFFRIAPMFYFGLLLFTCLNGFAAHRYSPDGVGFWQVALNLSFLHGWRPDAVNAVVPGSWSIACEWMFYLAFPFLLTWVQSFSRALLFLTVSVGLSLAALYIVPKFIDGPRYLVNEFVFFSIFAQLPAFACGFVVFHFRNRLSPYLSPAIGIGMVVITSLTMLFVAVTRTRLDHFLVAIPLLALFVLGITICEPSIFVNKLSQTLGRWSFSIYVVHHAILGVIVGSLGPSLKHFAPSLQFILLFLLVTLAVAPVAAITYICIERPMIRWGRRFASRPRTAEPPPVAA